MIGATEIVTPFDDVSAALDEAVYMADEESCVYSIVDDGNGQMLVMPKDDAKAQRLRVLESVWPTRMVTA